MGALPRVYSRGWFIVDPKRLWRAPDGAATFLTLNDIRRYLDDHYPDASLIPSKDSYRLMRPGHVDLVVERVAKHSKPYYQRLVERHVFDDVTNV